MYKYFKYLILGLLLFSCSTKTDTKQRASDRKSSSIIEIEYAKNFDIISDSSSKKIIVKNTTISDSPIHIYDLSKSHKKIICFSTSHISFIELLGMEHTVVGFPNMKYINSKKYIERHKKGELTDIGSDMTPNIESVVSLNPDAIIVFDMMDQKPFIDKLKELGIPIIYNYDFLEQTPLGLAEWIKFFGTLLGKERKADSIFNGIKNRYLQLQNLTKKIEYKPSVLTGIMYGDTWFVPGGKNWSCQFYKSAGAKYLWEKDSTSGQLELSYEAVYERAFNADYWIGASNFSTKKELLEASRKYKKFAPFKKDQIYNFTKRVNQYGGNDYFESGYTRPDIILADLIKIFHQELIPDHELYYFEKVK